ncbi:hypothetical protein HXX76_007422 [Chlamydomonas incerta]|uniref:Uncharacterized protein n=1 Tax=Chlamydomonas incerta TaxID=51695 RepID=A0A835T7R5_CHLIN|nr:hypothetical protein HXX76_007422 [Chlamydomonas incerta]|eukprot:KAG2435349.1 hypothetical protein HXX76_007422 [Chlamydomonas incerta]
MAPRRIARTVAALVVAVSLLSPALLQSAGALPIYSGVGPNPALPVYGAYPPAVYGGVPSPPPPPSPPQPLPPSPAPPSLPPAPPGTIAISLSATAALAGPATSCSGAIVSAGSSVTSFTTDASGLIGARNYVTPASSLVVTLAASAACTDAFTGLALPLGLSAPLPPPQAGGSGGAAALDLTASLTPTSRLLSTVLMSTGNAASATSATASTAAAYKLVGVNVSAAATTLASATFGPLDAIKQTDTAARLVGVQMLYTDVLLTSLLLASANALSAMPPAATSDGSSGASGDCGSTEGSAEVLYGLLATRAVAAPGGAVDLTRSGLLQDLLAAAASACGKDASATAIADAAALYGQVLGELSTASWTAAAVAELAALPLEALATAARVQYVLQMRGTSAVTDWSVLLAGAPVKLDAMAAALGMAALPAASTGTALLAVRATGALTGCNLTFVDVVAPSWLRGAATDSVTGVAQLVSGIVSAKVSVAPGCTDAVLSVGNRTVPFILATNALVPPLTATASSASAPVAAVIDSVAALASQVFIASAANSTPPRLIAASDYAVPYTYHGIGRAGAPDALPDGTDFVSQNWPTSSPIVPRAYLLSLRVQAAVAPTSAFLSALINNRRPVDAVGSSLLGRLARDLLVGRLALDDPAYLSGLMAAFIQADADAAASSNTSSASSSSSGALSFRRLLAANATVGNLDSTQLSKLLDSVAAAVAESNGLLTQLDRQVVAAANAGSPLNTTATLLAAAQVAAVQNQALTQALTDLASAVAAGDAAATANLTSKLASSFTGAALKSQVESAAIDTEALAGITQSGSDPAADSGDSGSGLSKGAVAGIVVGVVCGAVVLLGAALVVVRRVRRRQRDTVVPRNGGGGGDVEMQHAPRWVAFHGDVAPDAGPAGTAAAAADADADNLRPSGRRRPYEALQVSGVWPGGRRGAVAEGVVRSACHVKPPATAVFTILSDDDAPSPRAAAAFAAPAATAAAGDTARPTQSSDIELSAAARAPAVSAGPQAESADAASQPRSLQQPAAALLSAPVGSSNTGSIQLGASQVVSPRALQLRMPDGVVYNNPVWGDAESGRSSRSQR